MSYFGTLTSSQQTKYLALQNRQVRQPTMTVFIEGISDISSQVMYILTDTAIENEVILHGYIGHCQIMADNKSHNIIDENGVCKISNGAKIIIWMGFDDVNIKVWTGYVYLIQPLTEYGYVNIFGENALGRLDQIYTEVLSGTTIGDNLDYLASDNYMVSNFPTDGILALALTNKKVTELDGITIIQRYIELTGQLIYVDEEGALNSKALLDTVDTDIFLETNNVLDVNKQTDLPMINDLIIYYGNMMQTQYRNYVSMALYGHHTKSWYNDGFNYEKVASNEEGNLTLDLTLKQNGFIFTPLATAGIVDTVQLKLKVTSGAIGTVSILLYTDNAGVLGSLLATSFEINTTQLPTTFSLVSFNFLNGIVIDPTINHWIVIDTTLLTTGTLSIRYADTTIVNGMANRDLNADPWVYVSNEIPIHIITGSIHAYNVAKAITDYYGRLHERYYIRVAGYSHVINYNSIRINMPEFNIMGRWTVERVRHYLTESYITDIFIRS